jgi:hypothetical protein
MTLTTSSILDLEDLARKVEYRVETLNEIKNWPVREDYHALESLCLRFSEIAVRFSEQLDRFKSEHTDWSLHEGSEIVSQAKTVTAELIANGQPRSMAIFRRNLSLIFDGPKGSALDSSSARSRNKVTSARCKRICRLEPKGILSWAAAFPPTTWAAGSMKDHVFDNLVERIEPAEEVSIPSKLCKILQTIGAEEALCQSNKFREFIQGQIQPRAPVEILADI